MQVVAVAARKLVDAEEFAAKHGIKKAYGDYEDLAKDADIDVYYRLLCRDCVIRILGDLYWSNKHSTPSTGQAVSECRKGRVMREAPLYEPKGNDGVGGAGQEYEGVPHGGCVE